MTLVIRAEGPKDLAAITDVTESAFRDAEHSSQTEHHIVNALREAGQLSLSLVADLDGRIVGHVAISPVSISDGREGWFGLGPISVAPHCQGSGIGSALMREALSIMKADGAAGCVLLGEPGFYSRFGFKAEPSLILPGVPAAYFQALCFTGALPSGDVSYHPAFLS